MCNWCQRSRGLRQAGKRKYNCLDKVQKIKIEINDRIATQPRLRNYRVLGAGFYFIYVNLLVFMSTIISSVIEINLFSIRFVSFSKSLKFGLSTNTVSRIEYCGLVALSLFHFVDLKYSQYFS